MQQDEIQKMGTLSRNNISLRKTEFYTHAGTREEALIKTSFYNWCSRDSMEFFNGNSLFFGR